MQCSVAAHGRHSVPYTLQKIPSCASKINKQDFRRANLLKTRASRYEHALPRMQHPFFLTLKTLNYKAACTPFQRRDVGVVDCRRNIRSDGRARIQRATRAIPFRRAASFCVLRKIVCLPVRALHAPILAQMIRAYYWWETGAPRAQVRSRTRFVSVIECKLSPRAFIGQELFWNFVKRYIAISQSRAPFERGSTLVRKIILTDSRFPGTTELLSSN